MTSALMLSRAVLCCAVTARHVAAFIAEEGGLMPAWLSAAPLSVALKGCATPIAVFAPLPAEAVPSPRHLSSGSAETQQRQRRSGDLEESDARRSSFGSAILGRGTELAHVAELLADESVRDGALMVVSGACRRCLFVSGAPLVPLALTSLCVTGDESSGKSSFLRAAGATAFAQGLAVLPLAPSCSGAFDTLWMAFASEQHVATLPPDLRPLAPLLAELVPSAGPLFAAALAAPDSEAAMAALEGDTDAALCALAVAVRMYAVCSLSAADA